MLGWAVNWKGACMKELDAVNLLEEISPYCIDVILESISRYDANVSAEYRCDLDRKTKSTIINRAIHEDLGRILPKDSGFRMREINRLPGLVSASGRQMVRVKQLDKNLNPMNLATRQQRNLLRGGTLELGAASIEMFILGYRPSTDFSSIEKIVLFPNSWNRSWIHKYYDASNAEMIDLFDGISQDEVELSLLRKTGTDDLQIQRIPFDGEFGINRAEHSDNDEPLTELPSAIRIRSYVNAGERTGSD